MKGREERETEGGRRRKQREGGEGDRGREDARQMCNGAGINCTFLQLLCQVWCTAVHDHKVMVMVQDAHSTSM